MLDELDRDWTVDRSMLVDRYGLCCVIEWVEPFQQSDSYGRDGWLVIVTGIPKAVTVGIGLAWVRHVWANVDRARDAVTIVIDARVEISARSDSLRDR